MDPPTDRPSVVLFASEPFHPLAARLSARQFTVMPTTSVADAVLLARRVPPDIIILDGLLGESTGISVCRRLRSETELGLNVPILVLASGTPTPDERVAALSAGAWDFVRYSGPTDLDAVLLTVEAFALAKRNVDAALSEGLSAWPNSVLNRSGFTRRARELGSLLVRQSGSLACVVMSVDAEFADLRTGHLVASAARVSDVVGAVGPSDFAILAPGTDDEGVVHLAKRLALAVRGDGSRGDVLAGARLRAGYDTIGNLRYAPTDPLDLLHRATLAQLHGMPEVELPWLRRYEASVLTW